ncbi:MAG TPA: hypothetical protein VNA30_04645 [Mycobacteriales bacterium]|nr:hypothetical protein [Mycobacteriales bacterium]
MRTRLALLVAPAAASALALVPASAAPPAPQVTDPPGDANFTATAVEGGRETGGVGNQAYADVLSVTWAPVTTVTKVGKKKVAKVTAFTVETKLSAAPTPPAGTTLVYRMLGKPGDGLFVGPVYYTTKSSDPTIPQSALRDNVTGATRLTPIALPVIKDTTITWTVPLSVLPKEIKPGTTLTDLYFEVNEIEDFRGAQIPAGVPTYGGAYGLGFGQVDDGSSTASFKLG